MKNKLLIGLVVSGLMVSVPAWSAKKAASVIEVSGKVSQLRYVRNNHKAKLSLHDDLFMKDAVITGDASTARLALTSPIPKKKLATLFLYENSQLSLDASLLHKSSGGNAIVSLTKGFLRGFVKGLTKGEKVLIHTPSGVVGVRGTKLEVETDGIETSVVLSEGDAFWVKIDAQGNPLWKKAVTLKKGFRYRFNKRGRALDKMRSVMLNVDNRLQRLSVNMPMPQINDMQASQSPSADAAGRAGFKNQFKGVTAGIGMNQSEAQPDMTTGSAANAADVRDKPGYGGP